MTRRCDWCDDGYYSLAAPHGFRKQLWDSRGTDQPPPKMDMRPAGWRVEVNGTTVLSVADSQIAYTPPHCAGRSRGARELSGDCAGGSTPPSIAPSCRWGTTMG